MAKRTNPSDEDVLTLNRARNDAGTATERTYDDPNNARLHRRAAELHHVASEVCLRLGDERTSRYAESEARQARYHDSVADALNASTGWGVTKEAPAAPAALVVAEQVVTEPDGTVTRTDLVEEVPNPAPVVRKRGEAFVVEADGRKNRPVRDASGREPTRATLRAREPTPPSSRGAAVSHLPRPRRAPGNL